MSEQSQQHPVGVPRLSAALAAVTVICADRHPRQAKDIFLCHLEVARHQFKTEAAAETVV